MQAVEEERLLCGDQQTISSREEIQEVEAARRNVETPSAQTGSSTVVADGLASSLLLPQYQENKSNETSMSSPKISSSSSIQTGQASGSTSVGESASGEMEGISVISLSPQEILQKKVQRLNEVQGALPHVEEEVMRAERALQQRETWSRPYQVARKVQNFFSPTKGDRAIAQYKKNREDLAKLYQERETLRAALREGGNKNVALENSETHSKEVFFFGEKEIPLETSFEFGAALRAQIATRDTEYFLTQFEQAGRGNDVFGSIRDDLDRASFSFEREGQREVLYDRTAVGSAADREELLDTGIAKIKDVAGSPALQAAVASTTHQGVFSDIMLMEGGAPLPSSSETSISLEYYRKGLPELFSINESSRAVVHHPGKIKYELIEESPGTTPKKITLIATREARGERFLEATGQKFTQVKQDLLVKRIEENPRYDESKPLSVENSPVIFKCLFGRVANKLLFDPDQWKSFDFLLPDQQAAVVSYREARDLYQRTKEQAARSLNRIASHAASMRSSMSSERIDVEHRLQAARNQLQQAVRRLEDHVETAPFLPLNSNYLSEEKVLLQLSEETIEMPRHGCFIGGEGLQEELTSKLREEIRASATTVNEPPQVTSLQTMLQSQESRDPSFFVLEQQGLQTSLFDQRVSSNSTPAASAQEESASVTTAMTSLREFLNNDELMLEALTAARDIVFYGIEDIIFQTEQRSKQAGKAMERRRMPGGLFANDLLSEGGIEQEPVEQFHLHLEKRETPEGDLFVLTFNHDFSHQLSLSARSAHHADYERNSKIVYTFQKNASFDQGAPISSNNLPVIATCRYLKIEYEVTPLDEIDSETDQDDF